jgi:penicillin amidase
MRPSLARAGALALLLGVAGCRREATAPPADAPPLLTPPSGAMVVAGLRDTVTVTRDAAGIPHITAANEDDLFFAQGFVQAQDRLFQMDLWRRSVQGRLSEVLGANFIERDAMTRRVQYRGPLPAEWESYGPRTRAIAESFTRGINAWIARTGNARPEEFALAGWKPEPWRAEDLLNRTDAFLASGDAQDEVLRARLIASIGAPRADAIWPAEDGARTVVSAGVDLAAVNYSLGDLLRRVGTRPFFSALWAPVGGAGEPATSRAAGPAAGSNAWAVAARRTREHRALLAADPHRPFTTPSLRYLVHLTAPGWNVIGATAPWLPGVSIGHNDAVAWAYAAAPVDVQDLIVERLNPANDHQVQFQGRWVDVQIEHDAIEVKGRREPFEYDRLYTRHGVIVGVDRDRHLAYALRWSGAEPGAAGELAALTIDRAGSLDELRAALSRWKLPAADFVFADRTGAIGSARAALLPRRTPGAGRVPSPGWTGALDTSGSRAMDTGRRAGDPQSGFVAAANGSVSRLGRIESVLGGAPSIDREAMQRLQQDVVSWTAGQLVPLLAPLAGGVNGGAAERARTDLLAWDRRMAADSTIAGLYAAWESALRRLLVPRRVAGALGAELTARMDSVVPALTRPSRVWFDGDPRSERDALLVEALTAAAQERAGLAADQRWGAQHQVLFVHPLAITDAARRRFEVGPFAASGSADTVLAATATTGPALRLIIEAGEWDRSVAVNAPGQLESPRSIHFRDHAPRWAAGEYVPLPFSGEAIRAGAGPVLTLRPR